MIFSGNIFGFPSREGEVAAYYAVFAPAFFFFFFFFACHVDTLGV